MLSLRHIPPISLGVWVFPECFSLAFFDQGNAPEPVSPIPKEAAASLSTGYYLSLEDLGPPTTHPSMCFIFTLVFKGRLLYRE